MSSGISTIEESIKIALDAADAATDVTSEYNNIKKKNEKIGAEVKKVYMYTTIIFGSSIAAAIASIIFSAFIYFKSMSDLEVMVTTNREALLIFAENVDALKETTSEFNKALSIQEEIINQNKKIEAAFNESEIKNKELINKISNINKKAISSIVDENDKVILSLDNVIKKYEVIQSDKTNSLLDSLISENTLLIDGLKKPEKPDDNILKLISSHNQLKQEINTLQKRNQEIIKRIQNNDSMVKYP
tara:strand:+ start:349 stop:1086 length:738 start_codon:yes stop_codon:yes gene_type:complete